jgi:hypothetical protein
LQGKQLNGGMKLNPVVWLTIAVLMAVPAYAQAEESALLDRNPFDKVTPSQPAGSQPDGSETEKPPLPGRAETVPWTDSEVAKAKVDCTKTLERVTLDYEPLLPIKEGLCGAPAPIRVKSIGNDPKVEIDPPATTTCELAAALDTWLKDKVQPEAQALGSEVVKLRNAASYTCRNRYGSATAPLSEHALANALDISEFVLASGEHITVLDSWPRLVAGAPPLPLPNPIRVATVATVVAAPPPRTVPVSHLRRVGANAVEVSKASSNPFVPAARAAVNPFVTAVSTESAAPAPPLIATPSEGEAPDSLSERKTAFVRKVHDEACKTFGTTLGPDANDAHKNHFHLDMKQRRSGFCQ